MNVLPLLERELLVRARSNATYWSRLGVGVAGVVIGLPQLMSVAARAAAPGAIGRNLFNGIAWAEFVLACCACLFSADSVSKERREGTLGLLFLTRIKSLDVLVGKLGSAALTGLCGLLTLLPLLMVPVLAGGVTGKETLRMCLVLLNTMFFSLSAGLAASVLNQDRFKAYASAMMMVVLLVFVPFVFSLLEAGPDYFFGLLSPIVALVLSHTSSHRYWVSLGITHGFGWLLLICAAVRLHEIVGDREGRQAGSLEVASAKPGVVRCGYCGRENAADSIYCSGCGTSLAPSADGLSSFEDEIDPLDLRWNARQEDQTPIAWLLERRQGLRPLLWAAGLVGGLHFVFVHSLLGGMSTFAAGSGGDPVWVMMVVELPSLGMALLARSLWASAASRFFAQARRSGELELLLTTPLAGRTILIEQWSALRRRLVGPVALLVALVTLRYLVRQPQLPIDETGYLIFVALILAGQVAGVGAVCWLGLWFGLTARGRAIASLKASCLATIPPFAIGILLSSVFWRSWSRYGGWWFWLPQLLNLFFYVWLMRWAKRRLQEQLA